jgi:hypothetical protein
VRVCACVQVTHLVIRIYGALIIAQVRDAGVQVTHLVIRIYGALIIAQVRDAGLVMGVMALPCCAAVVTTQPPTPLLVPSQAWITWSARTISDAFTRRALVQVRPTSHPHTTHPHPPVVVVAAWRRRTACALG